MRIPLAEWIATGQAFDWNGHRIFVRRSGDIRDVEPLLLIHGFPTASCDWEAVWPALATRWPLLTLDLLGFGQSDKPRGHAYSIGEQADLCVALLESEGVAAYHVLAHDYGDTVAQELLARQRDPGEQPRLRSLAFLNGGLFPETHRAAPIQKLLASPLGPVVARFASRTTFARNLRRIFGADTPPGEELIDGYWALSEAGNGRAALPGLIRYIAERHEHRERWVGALQGSPVPLKLIVGSDDPISGAHMAARYRELVPGADVSDLDRIGHYPQVEAPARVVEAYLAFRSRVDAADGAR